MNTLSMVYRPYTTKVFYNKNTNYWELEFECKELNDTDGYDQLTREDFELMRDNAKRLHDAIDLALMKNEVDEAGKKIMEKLDSAIKALK